MREGSRVFPTEKRFGKFGLGVVWEAGEWVTRSGVVEIIRVRLQELMELL